MNGDLNNGGVSCRNVFIKRHFLSQCNESSSFNGMDRDVENGYGSGGHCFMNNHTLYEEKKNSYIYSLKKIWKCSKCI